MLRFFKITLFLIVASPAHAFHTRSLYPNIELTGFSLNTLESFSSPGSYQSATSPLHVALGAQLQFHRFYLGKSGPWVPQLGLRLAIPQQSGPDGPTSRWMLMAETSVTHRWGKHARWVAGIAYGWTALFSSDSVIALNNGTSERNFYTSSGISVAFQTGLMAGLRWEFSKRVYSSLDMYCLSPFGSRLRIHTSFGLGVHL